MNERQLHINGYYQHNGNWNYADHKGVFQFSDRDWYAIGECTLDINDIEPIQLTEEWLLKFWFKKDNYGTFYFQNIDINNNDLWLKIQDVNFGVALNLFKTGKEPIYLNDIEYVHQLQNLYFALCGQELAIVKPIK